MLERRLAAKNNLLEEVMQVRQSLELRLSTLEAGLDWKDQQLEALQRNCHDLALQVDSWRRRAEALEEENVHLHDTILERMDQSQDLRDAFLETAKRHRPSAAEDRDEIVTKITRQLQELTARNRLLEERIRCGRDEVWGYAMPDFYSLPELGAVDPESAWLSVGRSAADQFCGFAPHLDSTPADNAQDKSTPSQMPRLGLRHTDDGNASKTSKALGAAATCAAMKSGAQRSAGSSGDVSGGVSPRITSVSRGQSAMPPSPRHPECEAVESTLEDSLNSAIYNSMGAASGSGNNTLSSPMLQQSIQNSLVATPRSQPIMSPLPMHLATLPGGRGPQAQPTQHTAGGMPGPVTHQLQYRGLVPGLSATPQRRSSAPLVQQVGRPASVGARKPRAVEQPQGSQAHAMAAQAQLLHMGPGGVPKSASPSPHVRQGGDAARAATPSNAEDSAPSHFTVFEAILRLETHVRLFCL